MRRTSFWIWISSSAPMTGSTAGSSSPVVRIATSSSSSREG